MGAAIAGRRVQTSDVFVRMESSSGKPVKQVAFATDVEPFPDFRLPEYERLGKWFPDMELNKGSYGAVIVRTENKDPSNLYSGRLFVFYFLS